MVGKQLSISRLRSGGLITTYSCASRCRHCLYRSSPAWPKDFIGKETARKNLETVRRLGCDAIHLGGGEPLLKPEGVAAVLETAKEIGVAIEYVETNSSWYRNHGEACAMLELLASLGLTTLLVSISPLHNEYTPFAKVKGVLRACHDTGIHVFPWIADFAADLQAFDENTVHRLEEYQLHFGHDYIQRLPDRYRIAPGGRALETFAGFGPQKSPNRLAKESQNGCAELAGVNHFHLDLYGNYIPGLCAGLAVKREDLGKPLSKEDYPIISRLFAHGIEALVRYARENFNFKPAKNRYGSKCELCYEVRHDLVVRGKIHSHELQPEGHYLNK